MTTEMHKADGVHRLVDMVVMPGVAIASSRELVTH